MIAEAGRAGADGIWKNITGPAGLNETYWAREGTGAAESAAYWQEMLVRALRPRTGRSRSGSAPEFVFRGGAVDGRVRRW
ncbi:hypothetical protein ACIRO3_34150 [Streptomyces sp. NPDC102278]|uniref:hypothetical protein n=1 Tax=Streptomyces sp. NPDC102278 TaxID=3366152 RepID=UPI00381BCF0B